MMKYSKTDLFSDYKPAVKSTDNIQPQTWVIWLQFFVYIMPKKSFIGAKTAFFTTGFPYSLFTSKLLDFIVQNVHKIQYNLLQSFGIWCHRIYTYCRRIFKILPQNSNRCTHWVNWGGITLKVLAGTVLHISMHPKNPYYTKKIYFHIKAVAQVTNHNLYIKL